ncbi:MAG: hypothetical protein WBB45_19670 [Cyclobacteriaceae bacterium]
MPQPAIRRLNKVRFDDYSLFFLDANVWLTYLIYDDSGFGDVRRSHDSDDVYNNFFGELLEESGNKDEPLIILTSLLISEIYNRYMKLGYDAYIKESGKKSNDFKYKRHYRKRRCDHFNRTHRTLKRKIKNLQDFVYIADDCFEKAEPMKLLQSLSPAHDFNDLYYHRHIQIMAESQSKPVAIVTHDGDFNFKDSHIFTENSYLLPHR